MIWLPVSIFAICCVSQFLFVVRVSSALSARHPTIYRKMSGLFFMQKLFWFIILRGDELPSDPELTARVRHLKLLYFIALGSWLLIVILMIARDG
jgi:hypothetical protein